MTQSDSASQDDHKNKVVTDAFLHALQWSIPTFATSSAAVLVLHRTNSTVRRSLTVSSGTALCVSPAFFVFFLSSELYINDQARKTARERFEGARQSQRN